VSAIHLQPREEVDLSSLADVPRTDRFPVLGTCVAATEVPLQRLLAAANQSSAVSCNSHMRSHVSPTLDLACNETLRPDDIAMSLRRDRLQRLVAASAIWFALPSLYGTIGCMKKTLHIDEGLLRRAKTACHARTDTDTVRLGLEALVRHAAYERLRSLRGAEPSARDVPRRREQPRRRKAA